MLRAPSCPMALLQHLPLQMGGRVTLNVASWASLCQPLSIHELTGLHLPVTVTLGPTARWREGSRLPRVPFLWSHRHLFCFLSGCPAVPLYTISSGPTTVRLMPPPGQAEEVVSSCGLCPSWLHPQREPSQGPLQPASGPAPPRGWSRHVFASCRGKPHKGTA